VTRVATAATTAATAPSAGSSRRRASARWRWGRLLVTCFLLSVGAAKRRGGYTY
jgi:hypothetical protein